MFPNIFCFLLTENRRKSTRLSQPIAVTQEESDLVDSRSNTIKETNINNDQSATPGTPFEENRLVDSSNETDLEVTKEHSEVANDKNDTSEELPEADKNIPAGPEDSEVANHESDADEELPEADKNISTEPTNDSGSKDNEDSTNNDKGVTSEEVEEPQDNEDVDETIDNRKKDPDFDLPSDGPNEEDENLDTEDLLGEDTEENDDMTPLNDMANLSDDDESFEKNSRKLSFQAHDEEDDLQIEDVSTLLDATKHRK